MLQDDPNSPREVAVVRNYDDPVHLADRCPGVLRPHRAEDGLMVRLRLPGGRTDGATLAALGTLAAHHGNPELQLTTRAGLQLRGLPDPVPDAVVSALTALDLLPDAAHERVRNIVCSPLTGIAGGRDDLADLVGELDRALMASRRTAELSGRFLFALDDGRDDVASAPFDLAYRASTLQDGLVLVGGRDRGFTVPRSQAASTMIALAEAFLTARADAGIWHVRDLSTWPATVAPLITLPAADPGGTPLGRVDGAASVSVPLGLLTPRQLGAVVATVGNGPVILTTTRGLVLPGAADALPQLLDAGLVADAASPWALISACVGAPHCGRTTLDTRALATGLVAADEVTTRTHVSGCERRCGAPTITYRDVTPDALAVSSR